MNGRAVFAALLFCFWMYVAYHALMRGDATMAVVYLGIGVALTAFRLRRALGR
jgi:hypothetical protein